MLMQDGSFEELQAIAEWTAWQIRHQKLANMPLTARLHLAAQSTGGLSELLKFVEQHVFQDEEPAEGLDAIVECLEDTQAMPDLRREGSIDTTDHRQAGSGDCTNCNGCTTQGNTHDELPYAIAGCSSKRIASGDMRDVFGLLIDACAQEMGVPSLVVDQMLLDYEMSLQKVDIVTACAAMFGEA